MSARISKTEGWRSPAAAHGRQVEKHIVSLQARRRLAMHRFESMDDLERVAYDALSDFRANEALISRTPPEEITKDALMLTSMSLLPTPASRKSMLPFDYTGVGDRLMYLLNLDTDKPHPPRVVRAFQRSVRTGERLQGKNLKLWLQTDLPELDALYVPYRHPEGDDIARARQENALVKAVFADSRLSAAQLNALGRSYETCVEQEYRHCNEIVVAATPQDIEAIAVPLYRTPQQVELGKDKALVHATAQLNGALSGLAHAREGMDLPVMLYGLNAPGLGRFTYLAQGADECSHVALNAMADLQRNPQMVWHETEDQPGIRNIRYHAKDELGLDLFIPLKEQGIVLGKARQA